MLNEDKDMAEIDNEEEPQPVGNEIENTFQDPVIATQESEDLKLQSEDIKEQSEDMKEKSEDLKEQSNYLKEEGGGLFINMINGDEPIDDGFKDQDSFSNDPASVSVDEVALPGHNPVEFMPLPPPYSYQDVLANSPVIQEPAPYHQTDSSDNVQQGSANQLRPVDELDYRMCYQSKLPVRVRCPKCKEIVTSSIRHRVGSAAFRLLVMMFFCCCIPCMILFVLSKTAQDREHSCPLCNNVMGRYVATDKFDSEENQLKRRKLSRSWQKPKERK